jgi:hypothetical protein
MYQPLSLQDGSSGFQVERATVLLEIVVGILKYLVGSLRYGEPPSWLFTIPVGGKGEIHKWSTWFL